MTVTVSVLIPSYNSRQWIDWSVGSLLAQSRPVDEIIIVDDCSTDGSFGYIQERWQDERRVRVDRLPVNSGPAGARNRGLDLASCDYVALLDADDAWTLDRNENMCRLIEEGSYDYLADNMLLFDWEKQENFGVGYPAGDEVTPLDAAAYFRMDNPAHSAFGIGQTQPYVRRSLIEAAGLRYDTTLRYGEDFLFAAEVLLRANCAGLYARPGYIYSTYGAGAPAGAVTSQSDHSFDLLVASSRAFRRKHALPPSATREAIGREKALPLVAQSIEARRIRRSGSRGAFLRYVLARPQLVRLLLSWQLQRRTGKRNDTRPNAVPAWVDEVMPKRQPA